MSFKKIQILYREYRHTSVEKGSPVLFFFCFWLTKLFTLLQHTHPIMDNLIHALVSKLPHPRFIIKNESGIFAVQAFDDSTTICSSYFEAELRHWLDKANEKNIFIDIGANRGIYTIMAAGNYGFKTVHAFEPNAEMFAVLQKNVELNQLSSITHLHNTAVGRETSSQTLAVDPMHKGGGRITSEVATNEMTMDIKIVPLDSVLDASELSLVNFIKIDTEGYEQEVLSGMAETLAGMPNGGCLMIETSELATIKALLLPYLFVHIESSNNDHLFSKQQ